ncbi:MAG: hypothetical protein A2029_17160 [Chloroflexi bacterium RBG_19FT_COMBO_47_9]|nr:MAG: hypothetical protein A2029_17160 [Chloroflexi bacterium RBG_19FT_COMBO_47_9]
MKRYLGKVILFVVLWLTVLGVTFPLIWMVTTSFKPPQEVTASPPTLFPKEFTTVHFQELFKLTKFSTYFINSVIVAGSVTIFTIIFSTLGGYALARHKKARWMKNISRSVLLAYVFPQILLVIPVFVIIKKMGLSDSLPGLILTHVTLILPFTLMLLKTYFESIPIDYEESAMVDGANRLQSLLYVVIPMASPGILSTAIFGFIEGWNEFLFALVLISTDAKRTLPVGISFLLGRTAIYSWGMLMAAAVAATIPALIFFMLIQRNLVEGKMAGGIKG